MFPIAQSLGIVEEGSWLQNTSSHVIGTPYLLKVITKLDKSQPRFTPFIKISDVPSPNFSH